MPILAQYGHQCLFWNWPLQEKSFCEATFQLAFYVTVSACCSKDCFQLEILKIK